MTLRSAVRAVALLVVVVGCVGPAGCTSAASHDEVAVRRVVPRLLTDDVAAGSLPEALPARRAAVTDPARAADRATRKRGIWDATVADGKVRELEESLLLVQSDSGYRAFSSNEFVVTAWEHVDVSDGRADVRLLGHQRFTDESGSHADADERWRVTLVRSGDVSDAYEGWRLLSTSAVTATGAQG